ncbi:MAG: hypothetical protein J07HX64_02082 [halophilic archaeon J07HX64]|jgi:hypothetical protein|nr:MAG: hypothetical protein J07HX64_02082 [halophilic archaeon J07HX64]
MSDTSPRPDEQFCNTCGSIIKEQAEICPECGVKNTSGSGSNGPTIQFCESCGEQIRNDTDVCPSCGVPQESAQSDGLTGWELLQYITGSLFILGGIDGILTPEGGFLVSILTGIALIVVGVVLLPIVRQRFDREQSLTTLGTVRDVEEYPVSNEAGACTVCQSSVSSGVRREYTEKFVLFGVVLSSETGGTNLYCDVCAGGETTETHTHTDIGVSDGAMLDEQAREQSVESELNSNSRDE